MQNVIRYLSRVFNVIVDTLNLTSPVRYVITAIDIILVIAIIIYFTTIHFRKPYLSVLFGVKFNNKDSIKSYIGYKMNITVNVTTNAKTLLTYNQKCLL